MLFEKIHMTTWSRKEYFEHYFTNVPCTYSMTVKLDITRIKKTGNCILQCCIILPRWWTVTKNSERIWTKNENRGFIRKCFHPILCFIKTRKLFPNYGLNILPIMILFVPGTNMIWHNMGTEKVCLENPECRKMFFLFPWFLGQVLKALIWICKRAMIICFLFLRFYDGKVLRGKWTQISSLVCVGAPCRLWRFPSLPVS